MLSYHVKVFSSLDDGPDKPGIDLELCSEVEVVQLVLDALLTTTLARIEIVRRES